MQWVALNLIGRADEAEKIATEVLERSQEVNGLDHPATIECIDTLANIYFTQGRYSEAEKLCREAFHWRETYFGPMHHSTTESRELIEKLDAAKTDHRTGT